MDDDIQAIDSPTPSPVILPARGDPDIISSTMGMPPSQGFGGNPLVRQQPPQSKYAQLLAVIEEMGKDIRPTYAGSKSSAERLKRGIVHARILVRECLMETERSARQ